MHSSGCPAVGHRMGVVVERPEPRRPDEPVDLLTVNARCVMVGGRTKGVALLVRRRVNIGTAISDQMFAVEDCLARQAVVVAMSTATAGSNRPAIDEYMVAVVAHDIVTTIG